MGDLTTWFEQEAYAVRFDWGQDGAARAGARGDTVIIVDILRFSTAVAAHVAAGATVEPRHWKEGADTSLLSPRSANPSPRPPSLSQGRGRQEEPIALASPNGAMCCRAASTSGARAIFAGALVNSSAVAAAARALKTPVTVIACGEKWPDGSLRFALEDLLGAGAVIAALRNLPSSPEAKAARAVFLSARSQLPTRLLTCGSGIELIDKGKEADVHYAARLDFLSVAPRLREGIFSNNLTPDDRIMS